MGCMAVKPIVDRLEPAAEGRLTVIRLKFQEPARTRWNARWKGHDDAKVVFRVALSGRPRSLGHGCLSPRAALVYRHSHRRSSDRPRLWDRYECTDAGAAWLAGDGGRLLTPGYSSPPKKARRLPLQPPP